MLAAAARRLGVVATALACGVQGCGGGSGGGADNPPPVQAPPPAAAPAWAGIRLAGGDTTNVTGNQSSFGFDTPAANLDADSLQRHRTGDAEFDRSFIRAPNTAFSASDGLGPAQNNSACVNCHSRDGRANFAAGILEAPPDQWSKLGGDAGLFLRLGLTGDVSCEPGASNAYCAPAVVPGFGGQLFHRGVLGLRADSPFSGLADVYVRFEGTAVQFEDGSSTPLSRPVFQIRNPYDSPAEVPGDRPAPASRVLQADVTTSPRNSLPMFGLGLLEAIPEADILALADPGDSDGDSISGRPNWVYDPVKAARGDPAPRSLGRFGWKASTPSVLVQGASAYRDDIGITNYLFPNESIAGTSLYAQYTAANPADDGQAQTGFEVSEQIVKAVGFYASTLAVPARRNVDDPLVVQGATLFDQGGCARCHHPSFTTGSHPGIPGPSGTLDVKAVEGQTIYPFTDMLLHDMGDGLADGRGDFVATGREWKTRPLWGIGLTHTVNQLAGFLHDGRARNLEEAILWHGGEAEASKEAFRRSSAADRAALIAFLGSL